MSLDSFLRSLFDDGRVRAAAPGSLSAEEVREAETVLAAWEQNVRQEFPGEAPPYDPLAAMWAATLFYRAAQFAVYRDADAQLIAEALAPACPAENSAAANYSVDLVFRYLPDLARLAASAALSDPLLDHLRRWGSHFPLSSIGMEHVEPAEVDVIANHSGLLAVYVDRVLARGDGSRLTDPRVQAAAECAVGAFPELAGKLASSFVLRNPANLQDFSHG